MIGPVFIGKPCTLHARWEGELPKEGEYLRSRFPRAKYTYLIVEVEPLKALPHHLPGIVRAKFHCVRVAPTDVPVNAVIHAWAWNARKKAGSKGTHHV